jgi:plasmid maintenance system antidote protein VapI
MEAPFDVKGLAYDLSVFRASILIHLTDDRAVPADLAKRLWSAYDTATSVLEDLKQQYDVYWNAGDSAPKDLKKGES